MKGSETLHIDHEGIAFTLALLATWWLWRV